MTPYDHLALKLAEPASTQRFFGDNPEAWTEAYHFSGVRDTHDVYDAIDVSKNKALRQNGRVVLVVGASRGIGKATALSFARAGADGVILWSRDIAQLEVLRDEIKHLSPNVLVQIQRVDVTSEEDVVGAFAKAKEAFGMIDVAIFNSGVNTETTKVGDEATTIEGRWRHFEVHVKGFFLVARGWLQLLEQEGRSEGGTLITMSSTSAIGALPTQVAYGSSKRAADRVLEALCLEYPAHRFFSLHPGIVDTEITRMHDLKKYGWSMDSPELGGSVCLWLTTPEADFLRGRWVSANWRIEDLVDKKEQILGQGLLKSGLNAKLGRGSE